MATIRILVSRHSAFYTPLIATISGGFLKEEGLAATYGVLHAGQTSRDVLHYCEAEVIQSAVSSSWKPMDKGEKDLPPHFAQINCRDGFFLVGRPSHGEFHWRQLQGATVVADHAFQPATMLYYAAGMQAINWQAVGLLNRGDPESMAAAFRAGEGDYVHLQSPAAHQLEASGEGVIVASVGQAMPRVAFSSLVALREFPDSSEGQAFVRAFARAKQWAHTADAGAIAESEASFFDGVSIDALAQSIGAYQKLGCWDGGIAIPKELYEQALDVFAFSGGIEARHPYAAVVRPP